MREILEQQSTEVTEYDELLVRRLPTSGTVLMNGQNLFL